MLKLARGSSNFSVSSIEYDRRPPSSRPKREAPKRKGVHFNDELEVLDVAEPCTMSTSTFLHQKGLAWNSLARTFGCEEEINKDDAVVMNELLNLCSFWSDSEPIFKGPSGESDDDEDDSDEDFEAFEQHIAMLTSSSKPRFSATCSSSSSGVSSLRLNSLCRLSSQSSCRSSANSSETLSCLSKSPVPFGASHKARPSRTDELENAFKGIVEDDNEVSQDSVFSKKTSSEEDFWSKVEF